MLTETVNLTEYILKPRDERTAHINLDTACTHPAPKSYQNNKTIFKRLCQLHGITINVPNRRLAGVQVCHLCPIRSCSNPLHAYLGTAIENALDKPVEVRSEAARKSHLGKTPEERSKAAKERQARKTPEERSEIARKRERAKTSEKQGGKPVRVTEIATGKQSTYESIHLAAQSLGLHRSSLSLVCSGTQKSTGGYYAETI